MTATTFDNGVQIWRWNNDEVPNADNVAAAMKSFGYTVYDLQTVPPFFKRSRHSHDEAEIRGAVSGEIFFCFDDCRVKLGAGDILLIPAGLPHEVIGEDGAFSAYKGSLSGERRVTEHGDGQGSIESLGQP